jgi:hypothetical protein
MDIMKIYFEIELTRFVNIVWIMKRMRELKKTSSLGLLTIRMEYVNYDGKMVGVGETVMIVGKWGEWKRKILKFHLGTVQFNMSLCLQMQTIFRQLCMSDVRSRGLNLRYT